MGFSPLFSFVFCLLIFFSFILSFGSGRLDVGLLICEGVGRRGRRGRSLLDDLLLGRRGRGLLCGLGGLLGRLGRGLLLLYGLLGLGDLLGRHKGERVLEDGVICERLVLSIAEGLAG